MLKLYLIGAAVIGGIGFISWMLLSAKKAGRKEEQAKQMESHINEIHKINKRRADRGSDSIDVVREQLRKNARD